MPISFSAPHKSDARARGVGVTAVLGPTNTGKTHLAIERMVATRPGMIGLPLRLLAREVYNKVVDRAGADAVALITGEEKIKPPNPRFWICTVEAMPRDLDVAFLAIDEVQLGADLERGHVFTDRMLNRRGREETLVLGAATVRPMVERLLPGRPRPEPAAPVAARLLRARRSSRGCSAARQSSRSRPRRSTPSPNSIRRQRGGAAVVLGALSPRTRNAQVALYQSGDVDYLVATDAIGMGLNLDVEHVALRVRPQVRRLSVPPAQAGRTRPDRRPRRPCDPRRNLRHDRPLPAVRIRAGAGAGKPQLRADQGDAVAQHRARLLVARRAAGLACRDPERTGLTRAPVAEDILVLEHAARDEDIRALREPRRRSSGCGKSVRFRTIARSLPRPMRNSSPPSMVS